VLIDSTPAVARVWGWWARQHGLDPEETIHNAHGRPSIDSIRELLPDADHEAENQIVERREIEDLEGVVPLPGAQELLSTLPADRWTIATSGTRDLAQARIRAAHLRAPAKIITATDIVNGKPHPEPYLKAAALLRVPATECVVIEDATAGVRAGKAAGARVIAVRTTSADPELRAAGADYIVNNCADISLESFSNDGLVLSLNVDGDPL
jgi:sugar-phosphatase